MFGCFGSLEGAEGGGEVVMMPYFYVLVVGGSNLGEAVTDSEACEMIEAVAIQQFIG